MAKTFRYSLTIATSPGQTQDESIRSLRAFLKAAIRQWDIRCLSAVPIPSANEDTTTTTSEANNDHVK